MGSREDGVASHLSIIGMERSVAAEDDLLFDVKDVSTKKPD
jgi:hypothetical protein